MINRLTAIKYNNGSFGPALLVYGIGSALNKFIPILLVPVFTREFTTQQYGIVDIITSAAFFITVMGTLQLESALARFFYEKENRKEKKKLISSVFWGILLLSGGLVFITILVSGWVSVRYLGGLHYRWTIIIAIINILLLNLFSVLSIVLRFDNKPVHFSVISFGQLLITLVATILLVVKFEIGINGVFYGQGIGYALGLLSTLWLLRKYLTFTLDIKLLKSLFSYSTPLVPGVLISWFNSHGIKFFILSFIGLGQMGVLAAAMKVASVFMIVENGFRFTWSPFFWKNFNQAGHKEKYIRIFKGVTLGLCVLMLLYVLFIRDIYYILIDAKYWAGDRLLIPLGIGFALNILIPIVSMGAHIVKKTIYNSLSQVLATMVYLGLLLLLTPAYGLSGVAFAFLISRLCLFLLFWVLHNRFYPINYPFYLFLAAGFIIALTAIVVVNYQLTLPVKFFIGTLILLASGITLYRSNFYKL